MVGIAEHVLFKISNLLYPTEVRNRYQPDVRGYSLELRQTNLPKKTAIRITQTGSEERWLGGGGSAWRVVWSMERSN